VVVEDYNLAAGGRSGMTQTRIDTGSWTQKGKNAMGIYWESLVQILPYCGSTWETGG
jgi:hypothetical protein